MVNPTFWEPCIPYSVLLGLSLVFTVDISLTVMKLFLQFGGYALEACSHAAWMSSPRGLPRAWAVVYSDYAFAYLMHVMNLKAMSLFGLKSGLSSGT